MEPKDSSEVPQCPGLLDTYSQELLLSSLPIVTSDAFPAYRPNHKGKARKPPQKILFPPLTNLQRKATSPYSLLWNQRTLNKHFQVFIKSTQEVCRVKSSHHPS